MNRPMMTHKIRLALMLASAVVAGRSLAAQECAPGVPVAFVNVRVLTMETPVLTTHSVLIRDGRIAAIDPPSMPANTCRINGTGGVLMPGLADMHVHTAERELPLFLANGVTLVREMNGSPAHVALRGRIARGQLLGPRMLVASTLLVGTPFPQVRYRLVKSVEDAYAAAHEAKDAGYDYLKIYDGLTRDEYRAFVEASRTLGMPLDGHIPAEVGLEGVLAAGQYIQHMDKIAFALSAHTMDSTKLPDLKRMFAGKRAWVTPTLASLRALDMARTVEYANRLAGPAMAYVDSGSLGWWRSLSGTAPARQASRFYQYMMAVLKTLRETDARYLLGTDAANPLMVAGFSVHDELDALVRDGGFTPFEALATATRNVGEFVGDSTTGRIAVGARADLLLASDNPLENLSVLRRPVWVMACGRWLSRERLDRMLADSKRNE